MKTIKYAVAAVALSALSSANGNNKLSGTAVIYK